MMNKTKVLYLIAACILMACGGKNNEDSIEVRKEENPVADSILFKVAVMPTLDCLPLYVAESEGLFEANDVKVKLISYKAQMDIDTALTHARVAAAISDLVRCERMKSKGGKMEYLTATDTYWQLLTTKKARIKRIDQLTDKLMGMTRFSATSMLSQMVLDSAKVSRDKAFMIQINDVSIRSVMIQTNQLDAMWATEPWATQARLGGCRVIHDSRNKDIKMGVIALQTKGKKEKVDARKALAAKAMKAYDMAVDSINKKGLQHYSTLITSFCMQKTNITDSLPTNIRFSKSAAPREKDVALAREWMDK